MKKDVEQISVKTVRATSPLHKLLMVLHTECQKQPSRVFRHSPVLKIFENSPCCSNDCLWKLYL